MQITTRQALQILKTNHVKFKSFCEAMEIEPDDSKGKEIYYDLSTVVQKWIVNQTMKRDGKLDKQIEDARLKKAQADLKEMELAQRRGELMEIQQVESEVAEILVLVRNKLLTLPDILTALTFGLTDKNKARELATAKVREALEELSKIEDVTDIEKASTATSATT